MAAKIVAFALAAVAVLLVIGFPLPTEPRQAFLSPGDSVVSEVVGSGTCEVSYDGFIWYATGPGSFAPLVIRTSRCSNGSRLASLLQPPIPAWARPHGPTHTLFVATSFQEIPSRAGMHRIAALAHAHGIPVTWMTGQPSTFDITGDLYAEYHRQFGDDLQIRPTNHNPFAIASPTPTHFALLAARTFDWFRPVVAIEGSGYARDISADMADGYRAFWGIAWNSHGLDNDYDEGTPWGAYCADKRSYRRPAPDRSCDLVGLEWTARDLTRSAISEHEEFYSTDPDDLQVAGFDAASGAAYVRALVDAYAAAGESSPVVMISQQEADQMERAPLWSSIPTSTALLDALYSQARTDGLHVVTLAQAAGAARAFADRPAAVAFPYIWSFAVPEAWAPWSYRGPYPATIDYHDAAAGMTFIAGRTTPVRVFPYARAARSSEFLTLPRLQRSEMPA
ncbi:MAG: hypothetical protein JO347_08060, partial [Candidatus Eremiobacteraeota bacterium]|nr:hypothetical protein [Candidatus Eremiobacteraeota bacterium]